MGMRFENLDSVTRSFMTEEIELDIQQGVLYLSPWLTATGQSDWPALLMDAAKNGSDDTLAAELRKGGRIHRTAQRKKPKGGYTTYTVPDTAPESMAGEFNVFYVRALCRRAIAEGIPHLTVYRARHSDEPRPESPTLEGSQIDPAATLDDLRTSQGKRPKLGFPAGPNTGLSAKLS